MFKKIFLFSVVFFLFSSNASFAEEKDPIESPDVPSATEQKKAFFDGLLPSSSADPDIAGKIKDGTIALSDMPVVMIRLIDLFSRIAGTIAVAMLLWGGLQYIVSGVTEEKESAKNTIKYALIGLVVTFWAWVGINMLQIYLTAPQPPAKTTTEESAK